MCLSCTILNNSSTPFTRDSIKTYIDNLRTLTESEARLGISGAILQSGYVYIVSYFYKSIGNNYGFSGMSSNGDVTAVRSDSNYNNVMPTDALYTDYVERIN